MERDLSAVTVFCGASSGGHPRYAEATRRFGRELAARDLDLVYGGAGTGLMGLLADTVLEHGGEVIGVIPEGLVRHEVAHPGLTELHVVDGMHRRKALMAQLGDAFVAMPGGLGTAEEFFETLTWMQLGLHDKPIGLLNVAGYFDLLLAWLEQVRAEGFVRQVFLDHLVVATEPAPLLDGFPGRRAPANLFLQRRLQPAVDGSVLLP